MRVDLFVEVPNGQETFIEVKNGKWARFTPNQRVAYPCIITQGGTAYGQNAATAYLPASFGPMPLWTVWRVP